MPGTYDVAVVGAGGVGSAAMYHAARRGLRVVGLDRYAPPHVHGSSHGRTRIIRQAYFEHPDYVPLLQTAYRLWSELEQEAETPLYRQTGLLQVAQPDGLVRRGVLQSAERHGLRVEEWTAAEAMRRFPGFRIPADFAALYETDAGYLRVEECVACHLRLAARHGAELRTGTIVRRWQTAAGGVTLETDRETIHTGRVIVTAGPWAGDLPPGLGIPLQVRRKPQFWFAVKTPAYDVQRNCPAYLFELPRGIFYGFPRIDNLGIKVAEHSGGSLVDRPEQVDPQPQAEERAAVEAFLQEALPDASSRLTRAEVCLYTMSPDEHFIVGLHPAEPRVALAAGLSGHGFKFAGVLGAALADLACDGRTPLPIGFLSPQRFGPPG